MDSGFGRVVVTGQNKPDPPKTTPLPPPTTTTTQKPVAPEPTKPPPIPTTLRTTLAQEPPISSIPERPVDENFGPGDGPGNPPSGGFGKPSPSGGFGKPSSSAFGKPSKFGTSDGNNLASYLASLTPAEAAAKQRDDAIVNGFFYIFLGILATIAAIIFLYCLVSTILYCLQQNHQPRRACRRCTCAPPILNTYRAERSRLCSYSVQNRAGCSSSVYSPNRFLSGS